MNIAKKVLAAYTFLIVFGLSIAGVFVYSQKDGNTLETSAAQWETVCCNRKGTDKNYPFDYYASGNDCRVIVAGKQLASDSPNRMMIGGTVEGSHNFCDEADPARPIAVAWSLACNENNWFPIEEYRACSTTCGGGTQVRLEQNDCGEQRLSERPCNTQACPPSNTAPTITQWRMNSAGHTNFDIFNRQAYYVTVGAERVPVLGGNSNVSAQFSDVNNNLVNATRRLDYVSALITDPASVVTQNASGIAQARYDLPLATATSTGDAVVRFTATDAANAVTNATQNVIIDNIVPTASFVTAPAEGSTVSGTLAITADFQDNTALYRYVISLNTTEFCNVGPANHDDQNTPTNGAKNCSINTTTLADGNYQLIISAIDKAGNTSGNVVRNITVRNTIVNDTDLPTSILRYVGLNSAGYGTGVSNAGSFTNEANAKFEVTATDATSALNRIDYRCTTDGVFDASSTIENWTLIPSSSGASPLVVNFEVAGLADDSYTCETRATDAASNVEATPFSNDVVVNLDRALPTITFTNNTPVANAMLNGDFTIEVNVDGTFADDSRLHSVYFGVFRRGSTTVGQWCHAEVVNEASGVKSCNIDVSAFLLNDGSSLTEGDYDIWVSVQDKAVNQANLFRPISIDFTVSPVTYEWGFDVPPANYVANSGTGLTRHVTCNGYINNTNSYRGLWAVPTDVSGIVSYERDVVYNGSFVGSFTNTTNYTGTFTPQTGTTANGGQGVYYTRVRAIDGAGNKSISDLQWSVKTPDASWCRMTIDIVAPVTVLNAYTPNPTGPSAITFTGNVSDNLTNIANVEYRYSSDAGSTWTTWANITPNDTFDSTTEGFSFTTPVLPVGNYIFQTRGTDVAGNIETIVDDASQQTLVITSDTTAPVIAFNGFRDLANGTYSTTNPIKSCGSINSTGFIAWEWNLSNTESGAVTYTYTITAGPTAVGYTTTTTNTYYHGGIPAQGTYTVEVYGTDTAGNVGTPVQCSVTYDSTAPVTVLNAYTPNPSTDNTPTFTGTVTDSLTNIANVEYRYSSDGGSTWSTWSNTTGTFDSLSETFTFTAQTLADGNYIFQTRGTDAGGNVETIVNDASQQTLMIDSTIPVVSDLLDQTFTEGQAIPVIQVTASDANGIQEICYAVTGPAVSPALPNINITNCDSSSANAVNYTWSLASFLPVGMTNVDTSAIGEGVFDISYYVRDSAGNVSTTQTVQYTVNNVAPVVVLNAPTAGNIGTPVTFTGSFTDPSYIASGNFAGAADDASWNISIDYGNGTGFTFIANMTAPGNITIPNYTYSTGGNKTVVLRVCEDPNLGWSEGECVNQTAIVNIGGVAPAPIVTIDDAFAQIINGYACGWGDARPDDGLRVNVANWTSGMVIQGRYFTQGGSFSSWFDLSAWGSVTVNSTDATLTVFHVGPADAGNAGWEVRVVDSSLNPISNVDSLNYIITNDRDALACAGSVALGFEIAENQPQTGAGQCNVTTADLSQNNGNSSLQILRWEAVDFATTYVLNGYSWNGSSWVTSYSNYTVPNSALDFTTEPGYVIYRAWATNEGRYSYEVSAVDSTGNVVGLSTAITSGSVCTFTVDRTPVVPPAPNQGYVGGTMPFSVQRVSTTGIKVSKVNITELLKNLRARMLTK